MRHRLVLLFPIVLLACGESSGPNPGPTPPDPGHVRIMLHAPDGQTGAIRITVTGPGVDSLTASGFLSYSSRITNDQVRALILGDLVSGVIGRVRVPDRNRLGDYGVTVEEVATRSYAQRAATQYTVTLERE